MTDKNKSEFWDARRKALETKVALAALELFEHTGASAFVMPIKNTTPILYLAVGGEESLKRMLQFDKET